MAEQKNTTPGDNGSVQRSPINFTDSIAQREQSSNMKRGTFGKDPIPFPGGNGASLSAPVVPGVVGDALVTPIDERVLQHANDFVSLSKNGWKIDTVPTGRRDYSGNIGAVAARSTVGFH